MKRIEMIIGGIFGGKTYIRAINDATCIISKDFLGHSMTTMFGNTNPTTTTFFRVRRKRRVVSHKVNRLPPVKAQEGANIGSRSLKNLHRDGLNNIAIREI
jgi:hypothetical protein